jgi:hypothetical protein
MRDNTNVFRVSLEKPGRKILLGTLVHRWEDNIKIDIRYIAWGGVNWMDVARYED